MAQPQEWRRLHTKARAVGTAIPMIGIVGAAVVLRPETALSWSLFIAASLATGGLGMGQYRSRMRLFCPECRKHIPRAMAWICGFCDEANYGEAGNPIFGTCKHCKKPPGLLICPHPHFDSNGVPVAYEILIADGDPTHPAHKLTEALPGETIEETKHRWIRERQAIETRILVQNAASKSGLASAVVKDANADAALGRARDHKNSLTANSSGPNDRNKSLVESVVRSVKERRDLLAAVDEGVRELKADKAFQAMSPEDQENMILDFKHDCEVQFKKR